MDFNQIVSAVTSFARGGTAFVYILALAVGVVYVMSALRLLIIKGMSPHGHDLASEWGTIAFRLLIGSLLATLGWTLGLVSQSTGTPDGVRSALAYVQGMSNDQFSQAIWGAIRAWCIFIGTVGFFRGFLILNRATAGGREAGDDVWRAFWHILGGAITVQVFA